jgi:cysteinyl-tRNA synthetase
VQKLINQREQARKNKDFAKADKFRKEIEKLGFIIDDSPAGSKVRLI